MEFMQHIYVILWGVAALLTFAAGIKQKEPFAFVVSVFFVFMTVWYALRTYGGYPMFDGELGVIFKIVMVAFLVLLAGYMVFARLRSKRK